MLLGHYMAILGLLMVIAVLVRSALSGNRGKFLISDSTLEKIDTRLLKFFVKMNTIFSHVVRKVSSSVYSFFRRSIKKVVLHIAHEVHGWLTSLLVRMKGKGYRNNKGSVSFYIQQVNGYRDTLREVNHGSRRI